MIRLATVVLVMSLATPVSGQELFGLRLGDSATAAKAALSGASAIPLGRGGETMINAGGRIAMLCNDVVYSVQETIGSTLHDYASTVQIDTAHRGNPSSAVRNFRTEQGEISTVAAKWAMPGGVTYEVSALAAPGQALRVARSYSRVDAACSR